MKPDILDVQPQELKFTFELKKQSSCSVQLINKTNDHVAFKIKTTNPKKYCVRPNAGVIDPNALCDFTVTMQAPKVTPLDMICKDKFLVQSTIVPEGTKEEDVTSNMFSKEDGKIVDEKRLRVIFITPPDSSESSPFNDSSKLLHDNESRELKDDIIFSHPKFDESVELSKDDSERITRNEQTIKRNEELMQVNNTEEGILVKDVEEMKLKVKELESKLTEANATILHLTEEKRSATKEKHALQGDLDLMTSKKHRRDQTGFPLMFVIMVSLVSLYLGYIWHN